jgi:hypothetical protein
MPTFLAVLLASLLSLAIAAPALVAFLRGEIGWRTGSFYGILAAALLAWHVGFAVGPMPDARALAQPTADTPSPQRCEQVLAVAERAGIILDRSNPSRLVVDPALWAQIPEEARTGLAECAESLRPSDGSGEEFEVVNRTG